MLVDLQRAIMQTAFTLRIFRDCKEIGVQTCLDTSRRMGDALTDEQFMNVHLHLLNMLTREILLSP